VVKMRVAKEYKNIEVTLATVGYNSRREIARMADPFVGHVDNMVMVDGKYDFNPAPDERSTDGWLDYARDRYSSKVKEFKTAIFAGKQVDKRQLCFDIAASIGTDFLIVMDTDDYIHPDYTNWDLFYSNLVKLSEIVDDKVFMMWEWIPDDNLWPKQGNIFPSNCWRRSARIHKDPAQQRYCMDTHYMWCPKTVTDEELLEWQLKYRDADNPMQYVGRIPIEGVRITMDRTLRTDEQNKNNAYWAFLNQHAEQSRIYYKNAKILGTPIPAGYSSWEEFENSPHTFDEDGVRVDLRKKEK